MARTRPEAAEARAVQEVLGAAERTGAPVYFVHQTIPAAVDEVIAGPAARGAGVLRVLPALPHPGRELLRRGAPGAVRLLPADPRAAPRVDELGGRLAMGYVHTVGSDHCCYDTGQKELRAHDVRAMPNGLPGVETRLSVVWDAYVASGRISPQRFVAVMAANPARLNGLYPRKGTIAPGRGRRPRAVRPGRDPRRPLGASCTWRPTTRPTRAGRSPAGRAPCWPAAGSWSATASSPTPARWDGSCPPDPIDLT